MANGLSRVQFPGSGMDLTKSPLLLFHVRGYGLGSQK
jgi:hypothetical protein